MKRFGVFMAVVCATAAGAQDIALPSGASATLFETLPEETLVRFRFMSDGLAADTDYDLIAADMTALCETTAGEVPSGLNRAVVSLSSQALPLGTVAPEVVQFFEAYTIEDGRCMWEPF